MKRFIRDCKKYYKYAIQSGRAELKSEIADSHLSWLWWMLDPLLFMLVYVFVSLIVFGRAEQYFAAFIFIGYTTYKFFQKSLLQSVRLVSANKAVVKKVYLPKQVLLFTKFYVNGFQSTISFLLVFITMAIYRVPITLYFLNFIPLVLLLIVVTFGCSTILLHYGVYVADLSHVMTVALRLLFYMSGVFYNMDKRLDSAFLRTLLLKGNPIAFIIDQMRGALLYGTGLDLVTYFVWMAIALLLAAFGMHLIYKNENSYVKVI